MKSDLLKYASALVLACSSILLSPIVASADIVVPIEGTVDSYTRDRLIIRNQSWVYHVQMSPAVQAHMDHLKENGAQVKIRVPASTVSVKPVNKKAPLKPMLKAMF